MKDFFKGWTILEYILTAIFVICYIAITPILVILSMATSGGRRR